jgi:glutathione peroxidase-family protein
MRSNSGLQLQQWMTVAVVIANVASANLFCNEFSGFEARNVVKLLCL